MGVCSGFFPTERVLHTRSAVMPSSVLVPISHRHATERSRDATDNWDANPNAAAVEEAALGSERITNAHIFQLQFAPTRHPVLTAPLTSPQSSPRRQLLTVKIALFLRHLMDRRNHIHPLRTCMLSPSWVARHRPDRFLFVT